MLDTIAPEDDGMPGGYEDISEAEVLTAREEMAGEVPYDVQVDGPGHPTLTDVLSWREDELRRDD